MKQIILSIQASTILLLFAGCGTASQSNVVQNGRVVFTIRWPDRLRLIPEASNSIKITLAANPEISKVLPRLTSGDQVSASFDAVPVGSYACMISAFPTIEGDGVPQATASLMVTIQAGQTTPVSITMSSTIHHVEVSPNNPSVLSGQTISLIATAKDANDSIVLTSPNKWNWTSAGSSIATVDSHGIVTGVSAGSVQITANETESGKLAATTISVSPAIPIWPKFRHDNMNTGRGIGSGAFADKLWEFDTGGVVISSPAIGQDGTVYVGTALADGTGKLFALDGKTGQKKWETATGSSCQSSPAIGEDGTIFVGSDDGSLHAFDGKTGATKWEFGVGGGASSPLVGRDGTVYMGGFAGVYAVNGASGALKWVFQTSSINVSSPALADDGTLYIGSGDHNVYAIDSSTGSKKWEFITGDAVISSPAIGSDGTIYVGSMDQKTYALDGATGAKKWDFLTGGPVWSSPAISLDGVVCVGSTDASIYGIDAASGTQRWKVPIFAMVLSSPAIGSDGTVYIGTQDQRLLAINSSNGIVIWGFIAGSYVQSSPAIGWDGTLYVGSDDHKVYAIR